MTSRSILIVGAGQAGLQLALGLQAEGQRVTLISERTPDALRSGPPLSTQGMFHQALQTERAYGLNLWDEQVPAFTGLHVTVAPPGAGRVLDVVCELDSPGQSVDQRLKMAIWLDLFVDRGGSLVYSWVSTHDLDQLTALHDLTIVATGKGELGALFDRDPERSPYSSPQRALAVAYVHGLRPDPAHPDPVVGFHAVPGVGELFVIPSLTHSPTPGEAGPADILFWEAIPGGPADVFQAHGKPLPPGEHLRRTLDLARQYTPWVHERATDLTLTDARATLAGRYIPTVRHPIGRLPGGGIVLGAGDAVIANDPITGQGSNTAKIAAAYTHAILHHGNQRGDQPFGADWMTVMFEQFWADTGQAVTDWTNAMLQPLPEHAQRLLAAAQEHPTIGRRFANGFSDPNEFFSDGWFSTARGAEAYLAQVTARLDMTGPNVAGLDVTGLDR
jgi:2-polyprenyl-6-methoxyphenol hydroxylase-like FAD-dependent oxidoreductase